MSYNNGSFSLFNQTGFTISSAIYAESIAPRILPSGSAQYTNVYGSSIQPKVSSSGATSIRNIYGLSLSLSISASNMSILNAYCLSVTAPTITSGTCSFLYGLYVAQPTASGSGVISNPYTAFIQGMVGIGTSLPMNELDIGNSALNSGLAVGTYAGVLTTQPSSALVSGAVGVGTPTPVYPLDVQGGASAFQVLAPQTTVNQQMGMLGMGFNQGGFGGGVVGSNLSLSTLSAQTFNLTTLNPNCVQFSAAIFDGRYLYFGAPSIVARYDTTDPFASSTSYLVFTPPLLTANAAYAQGVFDGRYIYYSNQTITRYDTTQPFAATTSYTAFNTAVLNTLAPFYGGGCFDGTYIYLAPGLSSNTLTGTSGLLLRYNTTSSFTANSSYQLFDSKANISSLCCGFAYVAYDGRFVYYAPYLYLNSTSFFSGVILRYDTSGSFTSASSYQSFDVTRINAAAVCILYPLFDGRFMYFIPHNGGPWWVRYDTTYSFTNSLSYSFFNLGNAVGTAMTYLGGGFDGRYVYMTPNVYQVGAAGTFSGMVTRYDITAPFTDPGSYETMDGLKVNSLCAGFRGFGSDGQYAYFVPNGQGAGGLAVNLRGTILRIPRYTGQPVTAPSIGYSTGLTVSGSINFQMPTATTATAGTAGASPSMASGFLQVFLNGNLRYIPFY